MPKYKQRQPFHIGLMQGNFATKRDEEGRMVNVFIPRQVNEYPTLHELRKVKGHRFSDDQILTFERLRHNLLVIDRSEFAKTSEEKEKLKAHKLKHNATLRKAGFSPSVRLNVTEPQVLRRA